LSAALEDAGSNLSRVIKVTCFVADPNGFATKNALFAELFPVAPPVWSTPLLELPRGLLFPIDSIAVPDARTTPT
jgi:2-iminobutanoate/2-iminopropanoate deaminase